MYCKECGMKLLDGDPFCSACGAPINKVGNAEKKAVKTTASKNNS